MTADSRIPRLGPRGEGWLALQVILLAAIAGFGLSEILSRPPATGPGSAQAIAGVAAIVVGGIVAIRGAWDLGRFLSPFPKPVAGAPLVDTGAYRFVRHPIYAGLVLAAVGWAVVSGSVLVLIAAGLLFLLFDAKSRREEIWLQAGHAGYPAYRARTKRLIPGIY